MMTPEKQKEIAKFFRFVSEEALDIAQLLESGKKYKQALARMELGMNKLKQQRGEYDELFEEFETDAHPEG